MIGSFETWVGIFPNFRSGSPPTLHQSFSFPSSTHFQATGRGGYTRPKQPEVEGLPCVLDVSCDVSRVSCDVTHY